MSDTNTSQDCGHIEPESDELLHITMRLAYRTLKMRKALEAIRDGDHHSQPRSRAREALEFDDMKRKHAPEDALTLLSLGEYKNLMGELL